MNEWVSGRVSVCQHVSESMAVSESGSPRVKSRVFKMCRLEFAEFAFEK